MRYLYYIMVFIFLSCKQNSKQDEVVVSQTDISDGIHCADVTYYNPNTGTRSTYTLNVEVEDNELTKIYWGNGGWLDDSHFTPEELDKDGYCSFTSDRGYQYKVEITGDECSTTDSPSGEANAIKPPLTISLEECAYNLNFSDQELREYESTFNRSRSDYITQEMCDLIREYITKRRQINGKRNEMNQQIENGYITFTFSRGDDSNPYCQQTIVKRNGSYYWLEVNGSQKCTTGLIDFDPNISGWQNVTITPDPSKPNQEVFEMRILEIGSDLDVLKLQVEGYCNNGELLPN